uniref:Uncharacterized protein n=1 Tax=Anguilla anguilla TaxID=7936 RepID=A0A0E9TY91_ANGAN
MCQIQPWYGCPNISMWRKFFSKILNDSIDTVRCDVIENVSHL